MTSPNVKAGDIIESYQGFFAKVVEIKGSRYGLSAWVYKRSAAEAETVALTFLNRFGLSQVMKADEKKAPAKGKKKDEKAE